MNLRLATIVRWLLGAIFVFAGALKIAAPGEFHSDLAAYALPVPDFALRVVAVAFPFLEVFCGAALLAGFWAETVGALAAGLTLVFVVMLGQAVLRGLELKCGCFGNAGVGWFEQPPVALARAALMLWAAVWSWLKSGDTHAAGLKGTF
ncbi:MAG: DoxX family membrane protein [Opitutaceae bacterium]|nr:DoxX family membrane protein [Opitutaceae bacterium]